MTPEDREYVIARYTAMFDAAGEKGEAALLEQLSSPTKTAVTLSRGYKPGKVEISAPELPKARTDLPIDLPDMSWDDAPDIAALDWAVVPEEPVAPEPAEEIVPGTETEPSPEETPAEPEPTWAEMPAWEPETPEEEPAEASGEEAGEEPAEVSEEASEPVFADDRDEIPPEQEPGKSPVARFFGTVLFILGLLAVGLPLAAVVLCLAVVLLVPGAAAAVGAWLCAVAGLWCLTYLADALLLFGAAFLVLAIALLLLTMGLWCGVWLIKLYARLICLWARLTMGGEK